MSSQAKAHIHNLQLEAPEDKVVSGLMQVMIYATENSREPCNCYICRHFEFSGACEDPSVQLLMMGKQHVD